MTKKSKNSGQLLFRVVKVWKKSLKSSLTSPNKAVTFNSLSNKHANRRFSISFLRILDSFHQMLKESVDGKVDFPIPWYAVIKLLPKLLPFIIQKDVKTSSRNSTGWELFLCNLNKGLFLIRKIRENRLKCRFFSLSESDHVSSLPLVFLI